MLSHLQSYIMFEFYTLIWYISYISGSCHYTFTSDVYNHEGIHDALISINTYINVHLGECSSLNAMSFWCLRNRLIPVIMI